MNIILNTDSYKASHWLQYPPNTEYVYSYIESRGGKYDETVFFGLQIFIKEVLSKPITKEMINEAEEFFAAHGEPFNKEGWMSILRDYAGYLPVRVYAVPEGTVVPVRNILASIVNTDPEFYWLPSYLETALLRAVWYGTTVATNSFNIKRVIKKYLEETGDVSGLGFKLHDFGARGVSSYDSAGIGGAAHLVNFFGTDTVTGAVYAMKYYDAGMPGFSIPAAEHSTMTTWGGREGEVKAMENMLDKFGGEGKLVAVVSDSYDIYNAVSELWGKQLKEKVLNMGGTVVVRPDSGHPATVVLKVVQLLDKEFGSEVNEKGYRVLNPAVRVIQGDGINQESITEILATLKDNGYSADNIAFGMGGALLQQVNRDTMRFAMKASAAKINGEWIDVYKDPITDPGKTSKRGKLKLVKTADGYRTVSFNTWDDFDTNSVMRVVYDDGFTYNESTFDDVRERANSAL